MSGRPGGRGEGEGVSGQKCGPAAWRRRRRALKLAPSLLLPISMGSGGGFCPVPDRRRAGARECAGLTVAAKEGSRSAQRLVRRSPPRRLRAGAEGGAASEFGRRRIREEVGGGEGGCPGASSRWGMVPAR